ncbi:phage baseplate assembly protein V [Phytohabitans rumicis]|uniref:Baseplate assembly protein n=1 Tax=Phytohabitans rumicis TaxID=1076125 RepID=A0A6V8LJ63_9ACTN|nr:phage baseplate assembly protein V [Phytohabitans rumicis]GFJ92665.1 baseplate assembly protein [Phytohabitans rumicis]
MSDQYWGKYRGVVSDTSDPLMIGRIRAIVPDVLGDEPSGWALPCAPFGGEQSGFFALPAGGALVWIEFEHGDPDYPIWTGAWFGSASDLPSVLLSPPYQKVMIQTQAGHQVILDDTPGVGGITLQTADGQKLSLTSTGIEIDNGQGGTVKLTGPSVKVNDGALEVT